MTVSTAFLANYNLYYQYTYEPAQSLASWISSSIISTGAAGGSLATALLPEVERVNFRAINLAYSIMKDSSIWEMGNIISAILMLIPFVINFVIYLAILVFCIFIIKIPIVFGPLLIFLASFRGSRKLFFSGLDFYISAIATTVIATFFVAVSTLAIGQTTAGMPGNMTPWGNSDAALSLADTSNFLGSSEYWVVVILAWMSTYFLSQTPQLAGYFTGRVDTINLASAAHRAGSQGVDTAKATFKAVASFGKILAGRKGS